MCLASKTTRTHSDRVCVYMLLGMVYEVVPQV